MLDADGQLHDYDLLICGSRGGQVTLHELWRLGWRVRTINPNASALEPPRAIPDDAALIVVSCGKDFFSTRDPTYVQNEYRKYKLVTVDRVGKLFTK